MGENKTKFGISIDKFDSLSEWSIGVNLTRWGNETCLYINLFFIIISIGKLGSTIGDGEECI